LYEISLRGDNFPVFDAPYFFKKLRPTSGSAKGFMRRKKRAGTNVFVSGTLFYGFNIP